MLVENSYHPRVGGSNPSHRAYQQGSKAQLQEDAKWLYRSSLLLTKERVAELLNINFYELNEIMGGKW